jgi:hypothetical protein
MTLLAIVSALAEPALDDVMLIDRVPRPASPLSHGSRSAAVQRPEKKQ